MHLVSHKWVSLRLSQSGTDLVEEHNIAVSALPVDLDVWFAVAKDATVFLLVLRSLEIEEFPLGSDPKVPRKLTTQTTIEEENTRTGLTVRSRHAQEQRRQL